MTGAARLADAAAPSSRGVPEAPAEARSRGRRGRRRGTDGLEEGSAQGGPVAFARRMRDAVSSKRWVWFYSLFHFVISK